MKYKDRGPSLTRNSSTGQDSTANQAGETVLTVRIDVGTVNGLKEVFANIPDPRDPRGQRYRLEALLSIAVLAKTSGTGSVAGIGRWAANHAEALDAVGLGHPSVDTFYRMFRTLDADLVDEAMCQAWDRANRPPGGVVRELAVDGKAQTGSMTREEPETRTVMVYDQRGIVIAETQVASKGGEQASLKRLLAQINGLEHHTTVVTMDAGFLGQSALDAVTAAGAYWLVTVKLNRPTVHTTLDHLGWDHIPITHTRTDHTHGRTMRATVKSYQFPTSQPPPIPQATCAIRIDRTCTRPASKYSKNGKKRNRKKTRRQHTTPSDRTTIRSGKYHTTHETVYIITSAPPGTHPAEEIYERTRNHWKIEAIHWIRDVLFDEDASTLHTGTSPHLNAALNNFVISAIRTRHGPTSPIKPHLEKAAANLPYAINLFTPLKQ